MIVRSYLEWSLTASNQERAEAVGILVDVFLDGEISADERRDAEAALVLAAHDSAPAVRRTLAHKLGGSERAPRPLIATLSRDLPDIAVVVIANSPLLQDAALVDLLALGDDMVQLAVAQRPEVSPALAAAIAEVGSLDANLAILANAGAEVPLFSLNRLLDRFGDEGSLREALLVREDLPHDIRLQLVKCTAQHLSRFAQGCGWLPEGRAQRLIQETFETGVVTVVVDADDTSVGVIAKRLRATGSLTPQLLLRAMFSGDTRLLVATLSDLSGTAEGKTAALVLGRGGMGFRALYRKAGMPSVLEPVFESALSARHELGASASEHGRLSRPMIEKVLTTVALSEAPELSKLTALLLTYQAEAAIVEAKATVAAIMAEPLPVPAFEDALDALPEPESVANLADGLQVNDVVGLRPQADIERGLIERGTADLDLRLEAALDEEFKRAA